MRGREHCFSKYTAFIPLASTSREHLHDADVWSNDDTDNRWPKRHLHDLAYVNKPMIQIAIFHGKTWRAPRNIWEFRLVGTPRATASCTLKFRLSGKRFNYSVWNTTNEFNWWSLVELCFALFILYDSFAIRGGVFCNVLYSYEEYGKLQSRKWNPIYIHLPAPYLWHSWMHFSFLPLSFLVSSGSSVEVLDGRGWRALSSSTSLLLSLLPLSSFPFLDVSVLFSSPGSALNTLVWNLEAAGFLCPVITKS